MPIPRELKTKKAYTGCKVAVKPIADPSNGPVQGVATNVANIPLKKEETIEDSLKVFWICESCGKRKYDEHDQLKIN